MPNKMLIDATHPEETRVVVLRGNRVEEFDFESANRKQLRGNIYLAKVTRVEPSLQAAFVDYGGNRHGFLAFSEIHPDYYQIPIADRQALIAEEERAQRAADDEADHRAGRRHGRERGARRQRDEVKSEPVENHDDNGEAVAMAAGSEHLVPEAGSHEPPHDDHGAEEAVAESAHERHADEDEHRDEHEQHAGQTATPTTIVPEEPIELTSLESSAAAERMPGPGAQPEPGAEGEPGESAQAADEHPAEGAAAEGTAEGTHNVTEVNGHPEGEEEVVESVGGADAMEEVPERSYRSRRQYKIQEVIKRRQVMLVQVVKEERGTKGAALTTYLSLAGRYSVLMPNTARGGGISRKITAAEDRRKLKEIAQELEVPEGMGVILRTAGAARTKTEVKRDFEYLLRMWEQVRDLTLKSTAPTLVYEEGSLVKRSIRDLYNKDIDEIIVAGEDGYRDAREFMHMLMPSHARNVKRYADTLPIFTRFGIESQLDSMFQPVMQLRSGGYIVLNQTEALVAIDVNSGRATREHHIEDTALKTNLEAAEEIARQLRLRDLAGLIVIDFIDMDEKRNNRAVERRLKECLRHDRARIQVGHISHFGLLEMSRQRIRSSVLESSTEKCPHCGGTGHMRSVSSVSLQLLRAIDEMLLRGATHNLIVRTRAEIALYLLNHKRAHLRSLEERFRIAIMVNADETIGGQVSFAIEKGEQVHSPEAARALAQQNAAVVVETEEADEDFVEEEVLEEEVAESEDEAIAGPEDEAAHDEHPRDDQPRATRGEGEGGRGRRRRRRGRRGGSERRDERGIHAQPNAPESGVSSEEQAFVHDEQQPEGAPMSEDEGRPPFAGAPEGNGEQQGDGERRRRRRGRRGGRRNRRGRGEGDAGFASHEGNGNGDHAPEAELADAVADLDAPESEREQPSFSVPAPEPAAHAPQESAPAPEAAPAAPAPAEESQAEAPRRRSTVREPAPISFSGEASAPAPVAPAAPVEIPQPVVTTSSDNADRPRRSGWWSRRG
jgi:ribonuclease E